MTVHTEYSSLRTRYLCLVEGRIDDTILSNLKTNYSHVIKSNRMLDYIRNLGDLIRVLEKRDFLRFDRIKPLYDIQEQFVKDDNINEILRQYSAKLKTLPQPELINMYNKPNVLSEQETTASNHSRSTENTSRLHSYLPATTVSNPQYPTVCPTRDTSVTDLKLQMEIISKLSERLGRSWRDVARHLGITESMIESIQAKHSLDLKEQSFDALRICIGNNGNSWKINLLRALERARRKDLKELVEEMLFRN